MENPDPVLGRPVRTSLLGPHAHLALTQGRAVRYDPGVCPFAAPPEEPDDEQYWTDLADLLGEDMAVIPGLPGPVPAGWDVVGNLSGVQMRDTGAVPEVPPGPPLQVLGPDDVGDMLALVGRTKPGPFLPRTIEMGTYLGVRDGGRLVAMAGERMHPPGFTEVSAVCTDVDHRGRGLAGRLVLAVAAGIRARGETPFLHATAGNTGAIGLYEHLGFRLSARPSFTTVRPGDATLGQESVRAHSPGSA